MEFLKRRLFGIPVWILLAILVVAAFLYYRYRQAQAAASQTDGSTSDTGASAPLSSYDGASYAGGSVGAFQQLPYTPVPTPTPTIPHPVCVELKKDGSGRCKKWKAAGPGVVSVR